MKRATLILMLLMLAVATAQSPPQINTPEQKAPQLFQTDEQLTLEGSVVAYDWTTRYYMEGARVENFIFKAPRGKASRAMESVFVRVILLWHPADKQRVLPSDFYGLDKTWRLTVRTTTPFDFVRQYCEKEATPTFVSDIGDGQTVELTRYVSPAALPPDAGIPENLKTAISTRPNAPQMPDPRSLQCLYLEKVNSVQR